MKWLCVSVGVLSLLTSGSPVGSVESSCRLEPGPVRSVARVIDGETLVLDDGTTVRLLGVLAPRADDADGDPDVWVPAQQARAALEAEVAGRSVSLSGFRPRDRYGRLPAQVLILDGAQPVWLQRVLVAHGAVRVAPPVDGDACISLLLAAEAEARSAARGLWRQAAYLPVSAAFAPRVLQRRDTFQIVSGRVMHVTTQKGATYLGFGPDWRSDFTVYVSESMRRRLAGSGVDVARLSGALVEVRGWIERRNGPFVTLSQPESLRVLMSGE